MISASKKQKIMSQVKLLNNQNCDCFHFLVQIARVVDYVAAGSVGHSNSSLEAAEALRREVGAALRTDIAEILTLELRDTANSILLDLDHALQRLHSLPPFEKEKVIPQTLAGGSQTSRRRLSEANEPVMDETNKVGELKQDNAGDVPLSPIGNAAAVAAVTGLHSLTHTEGKAKHTTEPGGDGSLLSLPSPEAVQLQWSSTDGDNIPCIILSGKAGVNTTPNSTLGRLQLSISSPSSPAGYGSKHQGVPHQPFNGSGKQAKVIVPSLKIDAVGQLVGNGSMGSNGAGGGVTSGGPDARQRWNQPSSPRFVLSEPGLVTPARRRQFSTPTQTPQPQSHLQSKQLSVSPDATGGAAVADLRSRSLPHQHPVGAEGGPLAGSPAAAGEWKGRHAGLATVVSRQRRRNPQNPPSGYVSLLHCVKSAIAAVLTLICRILRTWSGQPVKLTSDVQSDAVRLRVTISKVK